MEATKRAKDQQQRRDRQYRVSQGLEVSDDEDEAAPSVAAAAAAQQQQQQKKKDGAARGSKGDAKEKSAVVRDNSAVEGDGSGDDNDGPGSTWLRPDLGDGGRSDEEREDDKDDKGRVKKGKKGGKSGGGKQGDGDDETNGKRKYMSLRERKREARKMAKTAKEEGDVFVYGQTSGKQEKSRGGEPSFGEVADAPPTITLKRKSGGKGAKNVPVAESGHKIAGGKGAGNRQAQIFKDLMQTAQGKKSGGASKNAPALAVVGLRRVAEMKALREQVIADYRQMRGRPMNNGRSASLAVDPSRLFSANANVGAATIRRDAGKKK